MIPKPSYRGTHLGDSVSSPAAEMKPVAWEDEFGNRRFGRVRSAYRKTEWIWDGDDWQRADDFRKADRTAELKRKFPDVQPRKVRAKLPWLKE